MFEKRGSFNQRIRLKISGIEEFVPAFEAHVKPQAARAVSAASGNHLEALKIRAALGGDIQFPDFVIAQADMADGLRAGRDDALKAQLEQVWHRTRVILVGVGQKQVIDLPGLVRGDVGIRKGIGIQDAAVKHQRAPVLLFQQETAPAMLPVAAFKLQFGHMRIIDRTRWKDTPSGLCSDWMCAET